MKYEIRYLNESDEIKAHDFVQAGGGREKDASRVLSDVSRNGFQIVRGKDLVFIPPHRITSIIIKR